MTQFESSVKTIPYAQGRVYKKLSDLNNIEGVKDRLPTDKIKELSFDSDTLSFNVSPVGKVTLRICEREPDKCIKFETTNSPLPLNLWIQIVPTNDEECKIKLTIKADIPVLIKGMVKKPLQEGLEKMVEMLSMIPY